MTVTINGTTGITSVNGTAAAPSVTGADTDTGIVYGTNTLSLVTGGATAVTVDSSQNVGIGTSSPTEKLHIVSATSQTNIRLANSGSNNGYLGYDSSANMLFYTSGSERARIDSSGNLLVGLTSGTVSGANTKIGIRFTGGTDFGLAIRNSNSSTGTAINFVNNSDAQVGAVNFTTTATSYVTSSDYRLKNTIAPMTGALAKVAALKPCTYKWNVDGSDGQGFIAHELAEVCPDAVTGEKDAVDADGNPQYQGIDTSFLVATLTAAIQELKAIVDAQGAEIAALKGTQA